MRSLARAILDRGAGGQPLPGPFRDLDRMGVKFRKADLVMLAGQPNAGKSPLGLWAAVTWVKDHGLRGLYFSADSPELVQGARALAMSSQNVTVREAEAAVENGEAWAVEWLQENLAGLRWSFDTDITYTVLDEEVQAFEALWGAMPDFIIVDNLSDVDGHTDDDTGTARRVMKGLASMARSTGACVIVLHHTSESEKEHYGCPGRNAIHGKVSVKPSLVLTVAEGDYDRKPVAIVKYRYDSQLADKSGQSPINIPQDYKRMHFS